MNSLLCDPQKFDPLIGHSAHPSATNEESIVSCLSGERSSSTFRVSFRGEFFSAGGRVASIITCAIKASLPGHSPDEVKWTGNGKSHGTRHWSE